MSVYSSVTFVYFYEMSIVRPTPPRKDGSRSLRGVETSKEISYSTPTTKGSTEKEGVKKESSTIPRQYRRRMETNGNIYQSDV